jgi:WD40 repeat protein
VLFIDQFEELFTLCPDPIQQRSFIQRIAASLEHLDSLRHVIIAIRGDFLDRCAQIPEVAPLINRQNERTTYMVAPLSAREMADAIETPAAQRGVRFELGLVPQIIADVGDQPGALPLLQYALTELWNVCISPDADPQSAPTLTWDGYRQIGGVQGALEQRAEQLYTSLHPEDQAFARQLLLELVHLEADQTATRRRANRETLRQLAANPEQYDRVIADFTRDRLLVADEHTVEVAHEALLSHWGRLKTAIEQNRESIRLRRRLEADCRDWDDRQQPDDYLLTAGRLATIDEWVSQEKPTLPTQEAEFLRRSLEQRDRKTQADVRRYRRIAAAGVTAAVCIAGVATVAGWQWRIAEKGQIAALVTSSQAKFSLNRNSFDALLDALQAAELLQQATWSRQDADLQAEVLSALASADYWVKERNRLEGHRYFVHGVSFSPNGQRLATASYDNTAKVWAADGQELFTLTGHQNFVTDVRFSPDGQRLVTASHDQTAKLWDANNGQPIATLTGHKGELWSANFNADGGAIVTASADRTARLWNRDGQPVAPPLVGHQKTVYAAVFGPDGAIATASADNTAQLWNPQGKVTQVLKGHTSTVRSIQFIDAQTMATASEDQRAKIWNRQSGQALLDLEGHRDKLKDLAVSRDGLIATASDDNSIQLWHRDGVLQETFQGHTNNVNSVAFAPDGQLLASASDDKTVRLWQIQPWVRQLGRDPKPVYKVSVSQDGSTIAAISAGTAQIWQRDGTPLGTWSSSQPFYAIGLSRDGKQVITATGGEIKLWNPDGSLHRTIGTLEAPVLSLTFSQNDTQIVSAGVDGTVRFWSLDGKQLAAFPAHKSAVYMIALSPSGDRFATASTNGEVKIWSRDRALLHQLEGHEAAVYDVSFNSDGSRIATASADNAVKLWNQDGQLLKALEGHQAAISAVSFSAKGLLATGSDDQTIKLWNQDGQLTATLQGHRGGINGLRFSPDGRSLVTASSDSTVLVWDIENFTLDALIQRGCNWLQDYLKHNPNAPQKTCQNS